MIIEKYKPGTVWVDNVGGGEHILLIIDYYMDRKDEFLVYDLTDVYETALTRQYFDTYAKEYI